VREWYKDDAGEPIILTPSQNEIFDSIVERKYKRVHCITPTQFGKSLTVALAVLTRASTFPEKWAVIAPSTKKAKIIMGYIIDHIFDNEYTAAKFEMNEKESRDRIRRERSKERINFNISKGRLGEVFILSTEGRRTKDVMDALMGFGSPNIILDESSLVDDPQYSAVKRMLGGSKDNFMFEIGNPFRRNHFHRATFDDKYHKIFVDWHKAVAEGRFDMSFIEEMKQESNFGVLYDCKFPDENAMDASGYSNLLLEADIKRANFIAEDIQLFGEIRMGVDVAAGGDNFSVIVLKGDNGAKMVFREKTNDTMALVGEILKWKNKFSVKGKNIFIDTVGVGKGVCDRMAEYDGDINKVNVGEKAIVNDKFVNLRAESYWNMAEWIKAGGKLLKSNSWYELLNMKYKIQSDRRVKMISKDELLRDGIVSPDVADALMLTFAKPKTIKYKSYTPPAYVGVSEYEGGDNNIYEL